MKKKTFYDGEHADAYLAGSVIRLAGNPIYINHVIRTTNGEDGFIASYWELGHVGGRNTKMVDLADPDIDLNPMPLGMLAIGGSYTSSCYLSRQPRRMWKQGLNINNLIVELVGLTAGHFSKSGVIVDPALGKTVRGEYFKLADAIAQTAKTGLAAAFGRKFAVEKNNIFYKAFKIPVGEVANNKITLFDEFSILKEVLEEDAR